MKQLTCEMCGSTDLVKQNGMFVCQSCGTKYSVEEARKMMTEGDAGNSATPVTANTSVRTVETNTPDELANLYQIARRAKNDNNAENAAKYYDMILVKDPTSWEAAFYVVYFKAMQCKIAQIYSAAVSVSNCEGSVFELIRDYVPENQQAEAVSEVISRCIQISRMLSSGAKNHYDGIGPSIQSNYTAELHQNQIAAAEILDTCGAQIERVFGNRKNIALPAAEAWKAALAARKQDKLNYDEKTYMRKIGEYDPTYEIKNEIKKLEEEISRLRNTIANPPKWKWSIVTSFAAFFIVCSGLMLFIGVFIHEAWATCVGVAELAIGFLIVRQEVQATNKAPERAKTALPEAESQLEKKKAELQALQEKQN